MLLDSNCLCFCGSNVEYMRCCRPFHVGEKMPETAELLMRSRFCAFVLKNGAYLLNTWEKTKCPQQIDFQSDDEFSWLNLEIITTKKGGINDSKGIVEFKAFYKENNQTVNCIYEISRFVKQEGRWFYVDGTVKSTKQKTK